MGIVALVLLAGGVLLSYAAFTGRPPVGVLTAIVRGDELPDPVYRIGDEDQAPGRIGRRASADDPQYEGRLIRPVAGRITSPYGPRWGRMHHGVDIACPRGTPVAAAGSGTVTAAGWRGAYGNYVRIRHTDSLETAYAHLDSIAVRTGQRVTQGQTIGRSGSTGDSTGPHLHFEVWVSGQSRDPLRYIGG